ncbi:MAG: hypothetical protein HY958_02855 [Bacteroidia bacterium]|nr:hypothetical protein [Bacteroidia bacterium]
MKKYFFVSVVTVAFALMPGYANSQNMEFMHSIGVTYMFAQAGEDANAAAALTYSPRVCFPHTSSMASLSVGIPMSIAYDLDPDEGNSVLAYEIPVVADFNVGHGAADDADFPVGIYAGGGYAFNSITSSFSSSGHSVISKTTGLYVNAGIRWKGLGENSWTLGAYSIMTIDTRKFTVFGIRILWNIEM